MPGGKALDTQGPEMGRGVLSLSDFTVFSVHRSVCDFADALAPHPEILTHFNTPGAYMVGDWWLILWESLV